MHFSDTRKKISIYINKKDRYKGKKLYRALLKKFYDMEVSGCTVFESVASYGSNFDIHYRNLSSKTKSLMIQVIETERKAAQVLKELEHFVTNGLVTVETINMIRYDASSASKQDETLADKSNASSMPGFSNEKS